MLFLFDLQDFPKDPTGQFDQAKNFVRENFDICKWIGLIVLILQVIKFTVCSLQGHVCIGA